MIYISKRINQGLGDPGLRVYNPPSVSTGNTHGILESYCLEQLLSRTNVSTKCFKKSLPPEVVCELGNAREQSVS